MPRNTWKLLVVGLAVWLTGGSGTFASPRAQAEGKHIRLEFNEMLHSRVVAKFDGRETVIGDFTPSESLTVAGKEIRNFTMQDVKQESVQDAMGAGQRIILTGTAPSLRKIVSVTTYNGFPQMAVLEVQYTNTGDSSLSAAGRMSTIPSQPGRAAASRRSGRTRVVLTRKGRTGCCRYGRVSIRRIIWG